MTLFEHSFFIQSRAKSGSKVDQNWINVLNLFTLKAKRKRGNITQCGFWEQNPENEERYR